MPRLEHSCENNRHHHSRDQPTGPASLQQILHPVGHAAPARHRLEEVTVMPHREGRFQRGIDQRPGCLHAFPLAGPADRQAELRRPDFENSTHARRRLSNNFPHPQRGGRDFGNVHRVFVEAEKILRRRGNLHRSLESERTTEKMRLTSFYRPPLATSLEFPCCKPPGRSLLTTQH